MAWTYVGTDDTAAPDATPVPPLGRAPAGNSGIAPTGAQPTLSVEPPFRDRGIGISAAGSRPRQAGDLPPEADTLYGRVRQAEGTADGDGYVMYGGAPIKPGKEHPGEAVRVPGPSGLTSAAGPGQWEEKTWNGLKSDFQQRFGHEPDFSSDADQKRMVWINAAKAYPGGEQRMTADIKAGKLDTSALAGQWEGFGSGGGGKPWRPTQSGKWNVSPNAVASAQGRKDGSVWWMSPDGEYTPMIEVSPSSEKRTSLLKSLMGGDEVQEIPELEVSVDKNGRAKITGQDGANRAKIAAEELGPGGLIPVWVKGVSADKPPKWIEDMHGTVRRFNFTPVPKAEAQPSTMTGMPGLESSGAAQHIMAAAGQGASEAFQDFDPGLRPDVRQALAGMSPGVGKEAATLGMSAVRGAELPFDVIGRAVNAALMGGARGAGQAVGEVTGEAQQPGFDPGIGAIREVIQPGMAFLGGAGAMPPVPRAVEGAPREAMPTPSPMRPEINQFLGDVRQTAQTQNAARALINARAAQDMAAGGAVPQEMARQLEAGRGEGMVLADVAGENVRGLLGNVAREPGPGREVVKQWAVNRLGDVDRDSPIATNIEQGIEANLATGSARTEAKALAEQRAASKPLWDKAMAGGSIAPLRTQLERENAEAGRVVAEAQRDIATIENEVTQAAARQSQSGNVYSASGANRARRFAEDKIAEKRQVLERARARKASNEAIMRRAQADDTANAPGAVWSPYIDRLLKNPVIQQGIRRGYHIERNIADGENRPFNAKEYAIVGQDEAGEPIVGTVPNMKLLAVAKEGMDAMLESEAYKDPLTGRLNKAGRAVKILRDGMLNELDRLNPDYKPARDKWAGDSALISAVRDGKNFHKQSPEEIREWFGAASESEKSFYRIGASDTMRDDLQKRVFAGDPSKAIINSPRARNQLLPMFRSAEDATKFLDRVKRARTMFETPVKVLGNSATAARQAEDLARRQGMDDVADMLHATLGMATGHAHGALYSAGRNAMRYFNPPPDPAVNAAVARLLTDSNLAINVRPGEQLLRSLPLPQVQNALKRGLMNYGRRFAALGSLP